MLADDLTRRQVGRVTALEQRINALERQETPGSQADAWARSIGMLQMFPGVVGIWPGSVTDGAGQMVDVGGNGNHLTNSNAATFNADGLVSYVDFNGTTQYFSHADGAPFDILGTEAHIAIPGLTMGCWAWVDTFANLSGYMAKGTTSPLSNLAYSMFQKFGTPTTLRSEVYSGTTACAVDSTVVMSSAGWYFLAMRYSPSVEIVNWANSTKSSNTTGVPASINDAPGNFEIGRFLTTYYLDGRISLAFLCAAAVPDLFIESFYNYSRGLFGV